MKVAINSRKLGKEVTFFCRSNGYIYVDLNGQSGTLGKQICTGGYLQGNTLSFHGNDEKAFAAKCRQWFGQYLKHRVQY
jgi:hypothetical protein